jgi:hypothetical protein
MAIPVNITSANAIEITSLPYSNTQRVDDAGTTYSVWYKYTPPIGVTQIGLWGFGQLAGYSPSAEVFIGNDSDNYTNTLAVNVPMQVPVTPGTLYYFHFIKNANVNPSNLTVSVLEAPDLSAPIGSILVPDDDMFDFFTYVVRIPGVIISSTVTNTVLRYAPNVPFCEQGDILANGTILIYSEEAGDLKLLDTTLAVTLTIPFGNVGGVQQFCCLKANLTTGKFYVGNPGDSGQPFFAFVQVVSAAGVVGPTTYNLGAFGLEAIASNNNDTILYYSGAGGSVGSPVFRWDLVNNVALTNFLAGVATYEIPDIIVLGDGTILVSYYKAGDYFVRVYNAAGVLQRTITPPNPSNVKCRMATAVDDPNSFWTMVATTVNHQINYRNYKVSDGSLIGQVTVPTYEDMVYTDVATATPIGRFGTSNSCPMIVTRTVLGPTTPNRGGLYFADATIVRDKYYSGDLKIPNPTVRTALIGE